MPNQITPPNTTAQFFDMPSLAFQDVPPQQLAVDHAVQSGREGGASTAFIWSCSAWSEAKTAQYLSSSVDVLGGQAAPSAEVPEDIVMLINPERVGWTIQPRVTKTPVANGTVFHSWRNLLGSNMDLPHVRFTFNTGNIYPLSMFGTNNYASNADGSAIREASVSKVNIFYRFLELLHQPSFTPNGEPNLVTVTYGTRLFPQLHLFLKITDPLTWNEDARNPNNVVYEVGGDVVQMFPGNFYDAKSLLQASSFTRVG